MQCDMCGQELEVLFLTEIEGTKLNVCKNCSRYGKIIKSVSERVEQEKKKFAEKFTKPSQPELIEYIVPDYSRRVRAAREKLGMMQEAFAKKISEKESLLNKIERGSMEPSIPLAKKLEKILGIKLIDVYESGEEKPKARGASEGLTIGDIIKVRKS